MKEKPQKVVAIGGGTGLSAILRGLKKKNLDLTAIVTVADDGGALENYEMSLICSLLGILEM